jgi:hypothetical protein
MAWWSPFACRPPSAGTSHLLGKEFLESVIDDPGVGLVGVDSAAGEVPPDPGITRTLVFGMCLTSYALSSGGE